MSLLEPATPTLSIIVPAFNVEKYIGECLDSILNQSVHPTEVIIVDDGSTDATFEVIRKYSNHVNWKILRNSNAGLAKSRNQGALLSTSDYLMFLDADDFIAHDLISSFRGAHMRVPLLDLYGFSFHSYEEASRSVSKENSHSYSVNRLGSGREVLAELLLSGEFHSSSCLFIFRKSLIKWQTNGFMNIMHEDEEFTPRLFFEAKYTFIAINQLYYYRRSRIGSIMTSMNLRKFLRSRIGYTVSLITCSSLTLRSVREQRLMAGFTLRFIYLMRHIIVPLIGYPLSRLWKHFTA